MSKAVLISIRPKWCEKIINGEKTVEIRKTRPQLKTPFKCYVYCTLPRYPHEDFITTDYPKPQFYGGGKVIGKFTCDRIDRLARIGFDGCGLPSRYCICNSGMYEWPVDGVCEDACLPQDELEKYLCGNEGYGWHISDLKIYDAPRELSEFVALRMCMVKNGLEVRPIDRPPQNWCYVEERDGSMEAMRYGDMQCCRCVHCSGMDVNSIGEQINYCELKAEWMNVTLGDCLGNCESEEGKPWNV